MSTLREKNYAEKFHRVFDYIDKHFEENLTVEQLSKIASFSKFHFHRQFSEYCGISVIRYIQLMRLKRASYRLVFNPLERIIDIALEAGFENPESFSRAFKNEFRQTPSEFRKKPEWEPWNEIYQLPNRKRKAKMEVKIVNFKQTKIAALEHRGDPKLVNNSVKKFIEWRKQSGLSPVASSSTMGIAYDNPETTAPEQFRFDICGSVTEDVAINKQSIITKQIPAGRCAVVRHTGSHANIKDAAYFLYRDWLPKSGAELRDFPLFFHYLNLIQDTPEHELLTDVYLPIK